MRRNNRKSGGFTVWEILIVVVLVGLFAFVALFVVGPNFAGSRRPAPRNECINNLRIIDGAKDQWATDHHKQLTDIPAASDLQPYMGRGSAGELPFCPNDPKHSFVTSYSPNNVGSKPVCRILPTNHILP
jgi:type II secretory pathway pseudopilin PulG